MANFFKGKEARAEKDKLKVQDKYWERLKEIVDAIFDSTETDRQIMTDNLEEFGGRIWDTDMMDEQDSDAIINLFFSTVQNIAPMLSDNKPAATMVPHEPYLERVGWSYNNALRYVWDTKDMQMNLLKASYDALIMKIGIFELGIDLEEPIGGPISIKVIDPRNFAIMPGYDEIWKSPLVAVRELLPLSWVRKNFPDARKVTPTESIEKNSEKIKAFKYGEAMDFELASFFAKVYRIWMKDEATLIDVLDVNEKGDEVKNEDGSIKKKKQKAYPYGKWVYFTENEFLGAFACKEQHGLPPFVELKNYHIPHNFLGMDENQQIGGLNKEFNRQFNYLVRHAKTVHDPDYLIDTSKITDTADFDNRHGLGGQSFAYDSLNGSPGDAITFIKEPPLDRSVLELLNMIPQLLEELNGVTEISKGQANKKERQSASEVGMMMESSHTRTRQRIRNQEWSIKRLDYLIVRMMQQYYTEDSTIWFSQDDKVKYDTFGSTKARLSEILQPLKEVLDKYAENPDNPGKEMDEEDIQQVQDYQAFVQNFADTKDTDPVLFNFSIEVQTNSSLPLDKQSLANLMLQLFKLKAVDREALLKELQVPEWQAILSRIEEDMEKAQAAKAGGKPPSKPPGGSK